MKVVFADFDGVFHPSTEILDKDLPTLAMRGSDAVLATGLFRWTSLTEEVLSSAPGSEDIAIVVHSSWRNMGWADSRLARELLGPLGHRFEGFTQRQIPREQSIRDFVQRAGVEQYVILDDAEREFRSEREHLIVTNPLLGMSDPLALSQLGRWAMSSQEAKLCIPMP